MRAQLSGFDWDSRMARRQRIATRDVLRQDAIPWPAAHRSIRQYRTNPARRRVKLYGFRPAAASALRVKKTRDEQLTPRSIDASSRNPPREGPDIFRPPDAVRSRLGP